MQHLPERRGVSTGLGLASILLWGTSIAVNRLIVVDIGLVRGPLLSTAISGLVGMVILAARRGELARLARLPSAFWAVCGTLFVGYTLSYSLGIGLAQNGRQILLFGILNYLWPVLTVAFSAAIFRRRVSPWFFAGIVLAAAAVVLAFVSRPAGGGSGTLGSGLSLAAIAAEVKSNPIVFILGLFCGISWALYSNLGKKIAGADDANPVPVLFLVSSLAFGAALFVGADSLAPAGSGAAHWSTASVSALVYRALLADLAAYAFWDAAMRRGNQLLVAAASLFTPLLSTASIAIVLGEAPGALFWAACVVAIGGAAVCRFSVREVGQAEPARR
jgi:drug/metabolite transporter (DMT)-like permease